MEKRINESSCVLPRGTINDVIRLLELKESSFVFQSGRHVGIQVSFYLLVAAAPGGPVQKEGSSSPAVRMRAEMGPAAAGHSALADSSSFLDVRVQGCKAELLSSTVANIGPFLEDEFSADGQPMKLHMRNITITIKVGYSAWIYIDI